jgi:Mg-chelatase subunit ChlD
MRLPPVALALVLLAATAHAQNAEITLTMDVVDVVRPPAREPGLGFLSGKALAHEGELELFDVVFVIDTSGSTADASGLGRTSGWLSRLPGMSVSRSDSVLGAEVAAIESLLDGFDPRTTRVGLVSFAGDENPYATHAWVDAPLTSNYEEIRKALADRLLVDPEGGTDLRAGLLRGAIELLGTRSAESEPRKRAGRHLVVLTDGLPTLPERNPVGGAIHSAKSLAKRGIRVHVFAIGREAERAGREIVPVAEQTHGEYHAVHDLSKLAQVLATIQFRSLRELRVSNKSTGGPALELQRDDNTGSWSALVPFVPGVNHIEVVAVASDGRERRVERDVAFGDVLLSADQVAQRDRLLELHATGETRAKGPSPEKKQKQLTVQPDPTAPVGARPP